MTKTKFVSFVLTILLCGLFASGCNTEPVKLSGTTAMAYNIVCYIIDDSGLDARDVEVVSGNLREAGSYEDPYEYNGNLKLSVDRKIRYYSVSYWSDTGEIEYRDVTDIIAEILNGKPGPYYEETDSFDIAKVNKKLKKG